MKSVWFNIAIAVTNVSEPACFGAALAQGIFYPEPAPTPGKREQNVGIFKTDFEMSKIRSDTCTLLVHTDIGHNLCLL